VRRLRRRAHPSVARSSLGRAAGTTTLRPALWAVLGRGPAARPASPAGAPPQPTRAKNRCRATTPRTQTMSEVASRSLRPLTCPRDRPTPPRRGTYALDTPPPNWPLTTSPTSSQRALPGQSPLTTATRNRARCSARGATSTNNLAPRPAPSTLTTPRQATRPPPPGHDHRTTNSAALLPRWRKRHP
jgi:hypothetical protein